MMELNKIYNQDCIEGMKSIPDKSIHLICTDPPYGLNYNQNDLASQREAAFGGKKVNMKPNGIQCDGEAEAMDLFKNMLIQAKRILVKGGCCCCGGGGPKPLFAKWTLLMDEIIGFKQAVVWDKGGLGMGIHYRRSYEFVLIAQNGNPIHAWNGGKTTSNVWPISKIIPSEKQHPTIKPDKLMEKIIRIHSNVGDTVLDPFMGSGVTIKAAIKGGRNYIGYEIDKKHFDSAEIEISSLLMQKSLF
jgi:site-specific DNA-methyltransferase (adenine-specific)